MRVRFVESERHTEVIKICRPARQLGFRLIASLDFDKAGHDADASFAEGQRVTYHVIRLPERFAIKMALVHGGPRASAVEVPAGLRVGHRADR
ncbi:hypothetical protein [Amycolatopsis thermoflava]|uniref:Uncharacterized protein n=1 Tax=Amycolatopsis thermoflava TaxID=84480 RepID=A0A3N2GPD7_9PSEU|nr:hypothetical protein [Amycolatopsis thermoflava]ROS38494.1 hypothetical protein EDD35_0774 [Amycolatopsis thermoflava]